jgi:hypothetical protein
MFRAYPSGANVRNRSATLLILSRDALYNGRSGTMICGVPNPDNVPVTEGITGVTSGGVVNADVLNGPEAPAPIDVRLFIWFG